MAPNGSAMQLPASRRWLSLVACLLLAGCGRSSASMDAELPTGARELHLVSGWQADGTCLKEAPKGWAPADAERPLYDERRLGRGELLPINAECLARAYSIEDLESWAARGDPVAEITLAYTRLKRSDGSCARDLPVADDLRRSGDRQEAAEGANKAIRTPESLEIAARIYDRCGMRELAEELSRRAARHGYIYIVPEE